MRKFPPSSPPLLACCARCEPRPCPAALTQIPSLLSAIAGTLCTTESELTSLRRVRQLAQLETGAWVVLVDPTTRIALAQSAHLVSHANP